MPTNILKYLPYFIIAILAVALFLVYDWGKGQKMTADSRGSIIIEQSAEMRFRETRDGKTIADKEVALARMADIVDAYPKLAKQLNEMDIKFSHLRTAIQADIKAQNSGVSNVVRDTIYRESKGSIVVDSIHVNDGFLSLKGEVENKTFNWKYSYTDSVTIALHVKKKWFLGKETLYSSIMLKNPNAKVTNSTTVQVKEFKDKRWVVSIGGSYDPFSNTVRPGVSFGFRVFAF